MSKEKTEIDKAKQANAFHDRGFNCAQSVACVFADKTDLDEKTLFRVTEGLGLGMGCMDGTCGAISAATVLAGLKCSTADLEHPNSKAVTSKDAKACVKAFKDRNGTVLCRELKGLDSPDKKVVRTCPDCIKDAVEIIETTLYGE